MIVCFVLLFHVLLFTDQAVQIHAATALTEASPEYVTRCEPTLFLWPLVCLKRTYESKTGGSEIWLPNRTTGGKTKGSIQVDPLIQLFVWDPGERRVGLPVTVIVNAIFFGTTCSTAAIFLPYVD